MNKDELLVFGGFNGKYMKEAHVFTHSTKKVRPAESQPQMEMFLFQMPTVFEPSTSSIFTVDWQKMKVIQFQNKTWSITADIKKT